MRTGRGSLGRGEDKGGDAVDEMVDLGLSVLQGRVIQWLKVFLCV